VILRGDTETDVEDGNDLSMRAVILDTAADAAAAAGVAMAGGVILDTAVSIGWTRPSPSSSPWLSARTRSFSSTMPDAR